MYSKNTPSFIKLCTLRIQNLLSPFALSTELCEGIEWVRGYISFVFDWILRITLLLTHSIHSSIHYIHLRILRANGVYAYFRMNVFCALLGTIRYSHAYFVSLTSLLFLTMSLNGSITITAPADSSTVSGAPLSITGTSSEPNALVRLFINTTALGSTTTDISGDWDFTLDTLDNGNYTITADIVGSDFEVLATDTNSFTVDNGERITITTPTANQIVFLNPSTASGTASLASTTVQLSLDSVVVGTTTTDASGAWSIPYTLLSNTTHTLLAELMVMGSPVASATVSITANISVIFPAGKSQLRVIDGDAITSGTGSGYGYTYSISGSIATISFVPAFTVAPSVIATGQRSSGSSTVTISSVSGTAASIAFSTGTQKIHFTASALQ